MHGLNCPKVTEPLPRDYLPLSPQEFLVLNLIDLGRMKGSAAFETTLLSRFELGTAGIRIHCPNY